MTDMIPRQMGAVVTFSAKGHKRSQEIGLKLTLKLHQCCMVAEQIPPNWEVPGYRYTGEILFAVGFSTDDPTGMVREATEKVASRLEFVAATS